MMEVVPDSSASAHFVLCY